jgi:two-component system response regulator LytT
MKILIVEDEELAVEKLQYMVEAVDAEALVVGCSGSVENTVAWLKENEQPDVILMDIELSDGQSFDIFNQVEVTCPVIFTTSYDEFAIKAFRVNSMDYLLKPISKDDLKRAFEKYRKLKATASCSHQPINVGELLAELRLQIQPKEYRRRFLVKQGQKHLPIETENIAYFFIHERTVFFKSFANKRYIVDYNMEELENMLDPANFFRVSRSCFV